MEVSYYDLAYGWVSWKKSFPPPLLHSVHVNTASSIPGFQLGSWWTASNLVSSEKWWELKLVREWVARTWRALNAMSRTVSSALRVTESGWRILSKEATFLISIRKRSCWQICERWIRRETWSSKLGQTVIVRNYFSLDWPSGSGDMEEGTEWSDITTEWPIRSEWWRRKV